VVARILLLVLVIAAAGIVAYVFWGVPAPPETKPTIAASAPAAPSRGTAAATPGEPKREFAEAAEPEDDEDTEFVPSRPAVEHRLGEGPIAPVDLTNLAPAKLGDKLWCRFVTKPNDWAELWESLHEADGPRHDPLEEPPGPPALIPGKEGFLVIGLGERARIDYTMILELTDSKFGEARYRFTSDKQLVESPLEAKTRPARVWLLPTGPMRKFGLVIEDKLANEIARFDPPQE
jgi:hypothetical protein